MSVLVTTVKLITLLCDGAVVALPHFMPESQGSTPILAVCFDSLSSLGLAYLTRLPEAVNVVRLKYKTMLIYVTNIFLKKIFSRFS